MSSYKPLDNNLLSNDFKVFGKSGPDNLAFDASKYGSSQVGGKKQQKKSSGKSRRNKKYTRGRVGKGRRTRRAQ